MIRSISPRWASEKLCARAGVAAPKAIKAAAAAAVRRASEVIVISSIGLVQGPYGLFAPSCQLTGPSTRSAFEPKGLFRFFASILNRLRPVGGNVVRLDPAGRAGRHAGLGARRQFARGLEIAGRERGLRRGEVGLGDVAL